VYVVLLTGGRDWAHPDPIQQLLAEIKNSRGPDEVLVLRHGRAARGADVLGDRIGRVLGYQIDACPASWYDPCDPVFCDRPGVHRRSDRNGDSYCPQAGNRRNQYMIDKWPRPDEVVAFPAPSSRGTWHCVNAARVARIPVRGPGIRPVAPPAPMLPLDLSEAGP